MSEHTKGRLAANYLGGIFGGTANGLVAQVTKTANPNVCAADARRLVACWNACDGIETADLERATASGNLAVFGQHLMRDRDELIADLAAAIAMERPSHQGMRELVRDLLAKHAPKVPG